LRKHKGVCSGERAVPPPRKFLNLKSKNGAFCALLSIDFKVYRLITETVSDHVRKTVTSCLYIHTLRGKNQEIADSGYKPTLHYRTAQSIAVDTLKWKDRFMSHA